MSDLNRTAADHLVSSRSIGADTRTVHPIHVSLIRPVLFAGAEPAVVIVETCVVFALLFVVGIHIMTVAIAAFWLTVVHGTMVWIAKQEPQMSILYVRSLCGRDFYAPQARAHAATPAPKPSIVALS
ncbi:MAG TPA: VirB3 family type IV secretion system protein [Gemmatimonadaceae bacterium]|nr:VirB3 family type IV secretion system protein [Gemmatimonadaceae bacterium]